MDEIVEMRPHHFVDILRGIGAGREFKPHPYGHAVHSVAKTLMARPHAFLKLVNRCDAICAPCIHNKAGVCGDYLQDRNMTKHDFNTALDTRLFDRPELSENMELTAADFCCLLREEFGDPSQIWTHISASEAQQRLQMMLRGIEKFTSSST